MTNPERASDEEIEEAVTANIEAGAGYQSSPDIRRAIEDYAMSWAERRLSEMGLKPKDKHRTESYDFLCSNAEGDLFVEVKGTQTDGRCIFLTPNEVQHAMKHGNSALFIRDPDQYQETSTDHDREVASWVIDHFLLGKERPFPIQ